jgi:octaprenyl-diphosphate synthase
MERHNAIGDTIERARHYGAIALDALAIFPAGPHKRALAQAVQFCIKRLH